MQGPGAQFKGCWSFQCAHHSPITIPTTQNIFSHTQNIFSYIQNIFLHTANKMDTSAKTNANTPRRPVTSKSAPSRSCPDTVFGSTTSSNSDAPPAIPAKGPARQRASLVIDIYKEPTYEESIAPSFRADRASSQSCFLSDELELKIDQLVWEIENMGPSKNPARLSQKLTDLVLDIYQKPRYSSIVHSEDSFNPSSQSDFLSDELEKKIDKLVLEIQNMGQPIDEETADGEISSHELQNDQAWVGSMESDSEIAEPEPKVEMLDRKSVV